jgi:hypothetical protein
MRGPSLTQISISRSSKARRGSSSSPGSELAKSGKVLDLDGLFADRKQAQLAQLAKNPVDVDGGETQRVGDDELAEGTLELGF